MKVAAWSEAAGVPGTARATRSNATFTSSFALSMPPATETNWMRKSLRRTVEARLGGRGHGDGVAVAAEAGGEPENRDLGDGKGVASAERRAGLRGAGT